MNGYFGMTEYTFAVEKEIYPEVYQWLVKYELDSGLNASVEYSLPGVTFRMVTIKIKTAPQLIIKNVNDMLKIVRSNNEWRKSRRNRG